MSIGGNIAAARRAKHLETERLAEMIGVPPRTVEAWEKEERLPETGILAPLAFALGVSTDALLCGTQREWKLENPNFDPDGMYARLEAEARGLGLRQTLAALPLMREKHGGQIRKSMVEPTPYQAHPLTMACHALAMGIRDDDALAALLLHDVVEDAFVRPEELPVDGRVREAVRLVSINTYPGDKKANKPIYYRNIAKDPLASLVKCIDRCNNLSGMADGFPRGKQVNYVIETEKYILPLLDVIEAVPEWRGAAWLLRYQIRTLLETFKRLL